MNALVPRSDGKSHGIDHGQCTHWCDPCPLCGGNDCEGQHGVGVCDKKDDDGKCKLCGGKTSVGKHGEGECIPKKPTNNPNGPGGRPGSWNWNSKTGRYEWTNAPTPPNPKAPNGDTVPGTYNWNSKTQSWDFTPTSTGGSGGGPVDLTDPSKKPTVPGSNRPGDWTFKVTSEGTGEGTWQWTETPHTQITNPNQKPSTPGGSGPGEWGWGTGNNVGGGWEWVPPGTGQPPPTGGGGTGGGTGTGDSDGKCPCSGCGKAEKDCTLSNCGSGCKGLCVGCEGPSCNCGCKHHTRKKCAELGCVNPHDAATFPVEYAAWKCRGDVCCDTPCKCCGKTPAECGRLGCVATCDGRGCAQCPKLCTCCGKKPAECESIGCAPWCTGKGCIKCPQKDKCTCCGKTPAECSSMRCVPGCPGTGCVGCPQPPKPGGGGDPDAVPPPVDRPPPPVPTPPPVPKGVLPELPKLPDVDLKAPDFEKREPAERMTSETFNSAIGVRFQSLQTKFEQKFSKAFGGLDPRGAAATDVRFKIPALNTKMFGGGNGQGADGDSLLDVSVKEIFQEHATIFSLLRMTMLALLGFFSVYSSIKIVYGVL
ncbi:MAG: hypothetical protein ACRC46_13335 [Thermoguttaceae bacterium]